MDHICSQCGCSSFHYNRSRMRVECDSCGHPVQDPQQVQQLMQYDKTYSQAMSHLTAGNWEQTINLLRPLMSQYPADKKLYLAVLRAATQDFRDIDMENTVTRTTASDAWDKLIRLNGVTSEMLRYGRQRYEKHRDELSRQRIKILAWIYTASFCSILAAIFFGTACYFLAMLCTGGLVGCLYKAFSSHPVQVIEQLISDVPNYQHNPFI